MQPIRWFTGPLLTVPISALVSLAGLQGLAAPASFAIVLGQTVTTNVPGPGAGVIESAGGQDVYTFTVPAGKAVYFDELTGYNCDGKLRWQCIGSKGEQVFDEQFGAVGPCDTRDVGMRILTNGGE